MTWFRRLLRPLHGHLSEDARRRDPPAHDRRGLIAITMVAAMLVYLVSMPALR